MKVDYVITGGGGFIGCAFAKAQIEAALAAGVQPPSIVAVDCLLPQVHPSGARPVELPASVELIVMDVCDPNGWDELFRSYQPACVVHMAAETGTGQSLELPTRHTHVNVTGTAELVEALNRAHHVPEQIVLTSSRAVYGEGCWIDPINGQKFGAGHRTRTQLEAGQFDVLAPSGRPARPMPHAHRLVAASPTSVYGVTKLAQEQILTLWCDERRVPLTVLRLQNVYGPGQSPFNPYTGIIGLFHRVAATSEAIDVYEDGMIGRDFIYIDDVTRCMAAVLSQPATGTRIFDVGSGVVTTILEAAQAIANVYAAPDPRVTGAFRHGDVRWAVALTDELATEFGFAAEVAFEEGNRRLSGWLRQVGIVH